MASGTGPLEFNAGVKVKLPLPIISNVPVPAIEAVLPAGYVILFITNCVTVNVFPSTSLSFVNTFPFNRISSGVVVISLTATGASFTGVKLIVTVPGKTELKIPSLT